MHNNHSTPGTTYGKRHSCTEEEVVEIIIETYFAVKIMMEEKYREKMQNTLQKREIVAKDEEMCENGAEDNEELAKSSVGV